MAVRASEVRLPETVSDRSDHQQSCDSPSTHPRDRGARHAGTPGKVLQLRPHW